MVSTATERVPFPTGTELDRHAIVTGQRNAHCEPLCSFLAILTDGVAEWDIAERTLLVARAAYVHRLAASQAVDLLPQDADYQRAQASGFALKLGQLSRSLANAARELLIAVCVRCVSTVKVDVEGPLDDADRYLLETMRTMYVHSFATLQPPDNG